MHLDTAKCGGLCLGAAAQARLPDWGTRARMYIDRGRWWRDGSPKHRCWRFLSRALPERAGVSLGYINQGNRESEQGINWSLNMSLVRWGEGVCLYLVSKRKSRNQKRLGRDAKKWFQG